MFGAIGEVVKKGGVLRMPGPSGEEIREMIPPLPKNPANLKLRYFLYCLAISPTYELGREADPSGTVASKAKEICGEIERTRQGYKVPKTYDERQRDAIIHVVADREREVLSAALEQAVIDPQNIFRFLKEDRNS